MGNEVEVRNDVSWKGLRRLHLVKAGGKFDIRRMLKRYGIDPGDVKAWVEYEDEDTQMYHLRVYWKEKEVNDGE